MCDFNTQLQYIVAALRVSIEKNISMVTNQKHVYPNLQLFRKRKKKNYSAMPHYIVLKLIDYSNHIL